MFDLPLANLDGETFSRANSFFRGSLMNGPELPRRDGSYQVEFAADRPGIREASGLAVRVLDPVLPLPLECYLG